MLCAVIVLGSAGTWAADRPRIWAPTLVSLHDVARNVLLYVPFGVFGVLSVTDTYPRHWTRLVIRVVGLAILFSASNEALQLYTIDRVGSLTDIVSAAIGTITGAALVALFLTPR